MGCDQVFGLYRIPLPDASTVDDGRRDGAGNVHDAAPLDATPLDSTLLDSTPPLDAFACTTHSQCSAMTPGNCCVNPGAAGYCTHGIIIGGACNPQ
jgi:hypothetical protein